VLVVTLLATAFLAFPVRVRPQALQTFTGVITDSECANGNHAPMGMGSTDAECVRACIDAHGAVYVLFDGASSYSLSDQKSPEPLAGKRVTVTGTLDAATKTIRVQSIAAASK
jgi:hypothetical protein